LGFGDPIIIWLGLGEAIMWLLFIDDELFIECIAAGLADGAADAIAAARSIFNIPLVRRTIPAG
jgi:hypothetical protein